MNNVSLIGRNTKDIEIKYTPSGKAVCRFSIAISEVYTKDGEKKENVSFIDCQAWGRTAETLSEYVKKGHRVGISGQLKQDRWEKDGQKFSRLYVNVSQIDFLEPKKQESSQSTEDIKWDE